jgi:beta-galactosidase
MPVRLKVSAFVAALCGLFLAFSVPARLAAKSAIHTFTVVGKQFVLDGKPYQIISGEMHYPRIARADWRDRFRKARAMGLNTITTYVFWNVHEPQPGIYDFSGQNDVAEYIREAQQEGLNIILRPGPYVCAEWEFGGYPSWLLKDRDLKLRSDDPKFVAAMDRWFARLGQEIQPLLLENGGPIIAIQVENEYGSFGDDHGYMEAVKSALLKAGMNASVLYTADGAENLPKGALPELPAAINFGAGDAKKSFAVLESLRPDGPRMSGEYWDGWFDHWGGKHFHSDGQVEKAELDWMLRKGYSVSIYMFHGGTNFGWMNGANSDGTDYRPDTTSYDYDAPLDEQGTPRQKYFAFRDVIARATRRAPLAVPDSPAPRRFSIAQPAETASLWRNLPTPIESKTPLTMEDLDQSYGYVLYRTNLKTGDGGDLTFEGIHDYAQVYVDQKLIGTLDRRLATSHLTLPEMGQARTLDILVENCGRLNYTKLIQGERKGLTGEVTLAGQPIKDWLIYSLPMNDLTKIHFKAEPCEGPCFYRSELSVPNPADTYLETRGVRNGQVWLNGQPLGRFWDVGPQYTLFTPGAWLKHGANEVIFFDLLGKPDDSLRSVDRPVFGETTSQRE